jgi:NAD(P)-dependent dehydrogenase (short-subunit alcohol dehydrogenase family)
MWWRSTATSAVPTALANPTKGGINSATKALAIEYAAKGIRVNAVSPGIIKAPMHAPETHDFLADDRGGGAGELGLGRIAGPRIPKTPRRGAAALADHPRHAGCDHHPARLLPV